MKKVLKWAGIVFAILFVIGLISNAIKSPEQKAAEQAAREQKQAVKETPKKESVDFSFAGVVWTDTPDIISKKIGQTGKFKHNYLHEIGETQDLLTFDDDYLNRINDMCQTRGKSITQYRWSAGLNYGDDEIAFEFSDETQKLLFYVFKSGKKVNKLFDTIVEKYGEPSIKLREGMITADELAERTLNNLNNEIFGELSKNKIYDDSTRKMAKEQSKKKIELKDADGRVISKKALGSYKWAGNGQSLYYADDGEESMLYVNTANLEEHAAIVQKKIKELEQSEKDKMKGVF